MDSSLAHPCHFSSPPGLNLSPLTFLPQPSHLSGLIPAIFHPPDFKNFQTFFFFKKKKCFKKKKECLRLKKPQLLCSAQPELSDFNFTSGFKIASLLIF